MGEGGTTSRPGQYLQNRGPVGPQPAQAIGGGIFTPAGQPTLSPTNVLQLHPSGVGYYGQPRPGAGSPAARPSGGTYQGGGINVGTGFGGGAYSPNIPLPIQQPPQQPPNDQPMPPVRPGSGASPGMGGGLPGGGLQGLVPGAYQSGGANMHVDTSITPRPIYTPGQTQGLVNNTMGQAEMAANPAFLKKGLDGRGVSRSIGSDAAVAPQSMGILGDAALAQASIPFGDSFANAQNMLSGETARDAEALGLANVGASQYDSVYGAGQQQQNLLLSLLMGML